MLENNYTLIFKDHTCKILDPSGSKLMSVAMKSISFHWDPKCEKVMPLDDSSQLPKAYANIVK